MAYIQGEDRNQIMFFSLESEVEKYSVARLIDAFIDRLDFQELGFIRSVPADEGRPGYDPRMFTKLYAYSYYYGIRSSRKIAQECYRNIEVRWLVNDLRPDFRTIADFRKDNPEAIRKVFKEALINSIEN